MRYCAGHAIILYLFFIHHLVPAAAACVRHAAHDAGHYYFIYLVFVIYLVFGACSGRMRETSCGCMMPAIIILFIQYLLFIYYLMPAACVRHLVAA